MIEVPKDNKKLLALANQLVEQCRVSVGMRSAYYRTLNAIAETGRYDGTKSLINMLYVHLTRTAAMMFSGEMLKFAVDFERPRPKTDLDRAQVVGKTLTRTWERNGTDITFGRGVFEALKYGAAILKQWPQLEGSHESEQVMLYDKLVMPWQFGVYREDENRLDRQTAMCETTMLTGPEVWQRVYHLPNADKLYSRIMQHAQQGAGSDQPNSFFHQVLSSSQINTGVQQSTRPLPGGIVQLNNDPNFAIMGPVIAAEVVQMHELWVKGEEDYVTIQLIEPDVLVAPLYKRSNLLGIAQQQPYRLIQPNEVTNWFWGRSELVDLIEPQALLSSWADDVKRLFGLQIDKILGFIGEGGPTDELYGQMRAAGYMNLPQGSDIKDLTPRFPPEAMAMLDFIMKVINTIGGFPEIMQGRGESGVRAGVHAETLLKTGSPTLRDRSLLVERQCAIAADLTLQLMEAKDPTKYWIQADSAPEAEATSFLLSDLPEDWRVTVDSHSTSPVFIGDTQQMVYQAAKAGFVTGEYVLDNLPFPNKETAKAQLREREKNQAEQFQQLMQQQPEIGHEVLRKRALKTVSGGRD